MSDARDRVESLSHEIREMFSDNDMVQDVSSEGTKIEIRVQDQVITSTNRKIIESKVLAEYDISSNGWTGLGGFDEPEEQAKLVLQLKENR